MHVTPQRRQHSISSGRSREGWRREANSRIACAADDGADVGVIVDDDDDDVDVIGGDADDDDVDDDGTVDVDVGEHTDGDDDDVKVCADDDCLWLSGMKSCVASFPSRCA